MILLSYQQVRVDLLKMQQTINCYLCLSVMPYSHRREVRGYCFPAACKHPRYISTVSTRYWLDIGFDIPDLRLFFPDGRVSSRSVSVKVTDRQGTRKVRFMVYFTQRPLVVPLNVSLAALKKPISWRGDVVVYRCSKSKLVDRLVNMHARDATVARKVVSQCALLYLLPTI